MNKTHSKSRGDLVPAFKISTPNIILPQRFHLERQRAQLARQTLGASNDIEAVIKVDDILATCKPETMQKMISQKLLTAKPLRATESESVFVKPTRHVSNRVRMNEIFLANLNAPVPLDPAAHHAPVHDENIADFDEGCAKIKELTKQNDNYQIYQQIQLKHEANGKAMNNLNKSSAEKLLVATVGRTRPAAADSQEELPDQYLETKSYFAIPIDFKMPRQLHKNQNPVAGEGRVGNAVGNPLRLEFPFREEFKEHQVTLELSKKAFPGILEVVSKADLSLRWGQSKKSKKTTHEFHISFNLGLTCELEQDLETANEHFGRFLTYSEGINDHFATCFIKNKIGTNLLRLGRVDEALRYFEENLESLAIDRRFVSLYNIGLCYKRQQRYAKALEVFQTARSWAETHKVELSGHRRALAGHRPSGGLPLLQQAAQGSLRAPGGLLKSAAKKFRRQLPTRG